MEPLPDWVFNTVVAVLFAALVGVFIMAQAERKRQDRIDRRRLREDLGLPPYGDVDYPFHDDGE